MKPLASGAIPQNNIASAIECLQYALSMPTSVVINGCDSMERLDQAFEATRTFKPLTKAQVDALVAKTREAALSGKYELFKTSIRFDGTAQHPEWMGEADYLTGDARWHYAKNGRRRNLSRKPRLRRTIRLRATFI
jgi:hypothetical protein